MRSFVLDGPFSLNGYAEVPENAPSDYMDNVYDDLDVWGGLTFSGYGIVRYGELISIYNNDSVWKDDESEMSKESIKTKSGVYADGDEIVKIVGFDDSHLDSCITRTCGGDPQARIKSSSLILVLPAHAGVILK